MIKFSTKHITVDGRRCGVSYCKGPYVTLPAGTITIYPRRGSFPAGTRAYLAVENDSNSQTDYFESDRIRVFSDHPLYAAVAAAAA